MSNGEWSTTRGAAGCAPTRAGARARTLLLPAALVVAGWMLSRPAAEPASLALVWEAGAVEASGAALGAERPRAELRRGDWVLTRGDCLAELAGEDTEVELGADTWVLVEEVAPPRLRLEGGALDVRGPCAVTTRAGIAEVEEGSARVALEGAVLRVSCRRGRVVVVDASGERVLGPGERTGGTLETAAAAPRETQAGDR